MEKPVMRLDPLTEVWTIFTEERARPPAFGSVREEQGPDPFRVGREHLAPQTLHEVRGRDSWQVRVVPNRTPALGVEGDAARHPDGFYDRMDGVGAHEVVIETPGTEAFESLSLEAIQHIITTWKVRMLELMKDVRLRTFTVVKDVGRAAGGTVPHALSQILALAVIPPQLKRKLEIGRAFYEAKKRSIFEDILREEMRTGARLVYENTGFAVFCPYASRAPFEIAIYPKRQCPDFHGLSDQEIVQLADVLRVTLGKLSRALDNPAYNLMLITAPTRTRRSDHWGTLEMDFRWHVEILPRLQHVSGIELATGCFVNTVWPETAADYLRSTHLPE